MDFNTTICCKDILFHLKRNTKIKLIDLPMWNWEVGSFSNIFTGFNPYMESLGA